MTSRKKLIIAAAAIFIVGCLLIAALMLAGPALAPWLCQFMLEEPVCSQFRP